MSRALIAGLALALAVTLAQPAVADTPPEAAAAAQALYEEAGKLAQEKRWAEACTKLEASDKLDPAPGTRMRLASCYEHVGRTASAWSTYHDVPALTKSDDKRAKQAELDVKRLDPTLARILLDVAPENRTPAVEIRRDGLLIVAGAWGSAVPIDPGAHTLEATAPGKQPWKTTVTIEAKPGVTTVQVPALEDVLAAPAAPVAVEAPPYWSPQRIAGAGVAGAGVVSAIVGAVFGARAISKMSLSNQTCHATGSTDACDAPGLAARNDAKTAATASDVTLAVGAAAFAAGAAVFFTAPSGAKAPASATAPRLGIGHVGATGTGLLWTGDW